MKIYNGITGMNNTDCSDLDNDFISDLFPRVIPNIRLSDADTSSRLDKSASHYRMDQCRRGVAVIFNQALPRCCKENERKYVDSDVASLCNTFDKLGFDIETFNELTFNEVQSTLEDMSQKDHSDCDCFVLVYLSRGADGKLRARDRLFNVNCLWSCFTAEQAPTLANKPKVYIVHTYKEYSRSERRQGVSVDCATEDNCSESDKLRSYFIPDRADFLITLSTVQGMFCPRNSPGSGSLYIQTLCQHLDRLGFNQDIVTILTEVNNQILQMSNNTPQNIDNDGIKQLPIIISLLIRILQFTEKSGVLPRNKRKRALIFEIDSEEEECGGAEEDSESQNTSHKRKKIKKNMSRSQ